ncbi:sigma-70 family RNA polymerase sigma factor [Telmatocola sphagniphila]|uniref:Sigma-70 family RNA polymerase sigma factor n=1 Tax=Telmatocola sphagniphila TaxID=1123043 RepID=A0A8E6EUC4_9BACT|nr:sigma-70 family RNA polymerase sigma factor [Telmatocola sphagniphila]QVL33544.1 sigma-70 family RNA polymerase sigma factor [Telmatocola sphagniphila]
MNQKYLEATKLWTLAVPTVSAFITSQVRDFQDRDDLLQEIAVAVLESFERYDPKASFLGWCIGIARNQIHLYFRRKNRDRLAFDTETVDRIAQAFENSSLKENGLDYLTECYEKLDSKAKSLCNFRYQQDLKPAQISDQMGMTPNLVAKALQRIRDRLRDCLERKKAAEVIL